MIIDCIADLHGHYPELAGGDLLIVAGDFTATHTEREMFEFGEWFIAQPYTNKIWIAGNHDNYMWNGYRNGSGIEFTGSQYLCDSGTEFEYDHVEFALDSALNLSRKKKLKIWGSPWTLAFDGINPKCTAFTGNEKLLAEKFALIPADVDILITHGPPFGVMDSVDRFTKWGTKQISVGSRELRHRLFSESIKPKLHVFGHIHEGHGHVAKMIDYPGVQFVNCSHVNEHYEPVNKPIRIIL